MLAHILSADLINLFMYSFSGNAKYKIAATGADTHPTEKYNHSKNAHAILRINFDVGWKRMLCDSPEIE
jgi:hypothetical protein